MDELTRGVQIVYVPDHAEGDLKHPDCEEGFVTSIKGRVVFCRFWHKQYPDELRTKGCSEGADLSNIFVHVSRPESQVEKALRRYCAPVLKWGEEVWPR